MADPPLPRSRPRRGYNTPPFRRGLIDSNLPWNNVLETYYDDKLEASMQLAREAGLGTGGAFLTTYRVIEAEFLTREASILVDRGDWLMLEFQSLEGESDERVEEFVKTLVMAGCDQIAREYGWKHDVPVLFTLMHPATHAPYVPNRDGYYTDKYPYDKICLPAGLLQVPDRFVAAIRHEYAHSMALHRTMGACPTWLHEAVAMVSEHGLGLRSRVRIWKSPNELDGAFRADRNSESGLRTVSDAYLQSYVLGRYLMELKGSEGIGALLDAFSDNSFAQELVMRIKNERPEDEALRQVYGINLKELFRLAKS